MPVYDLYSKRQKRLRQKASDVFVYDDIPPQLRVQIIQILRDVIGNVEREHAFRMYERIHDVLCREYGEFALADGALPNHRIETFLVKERNTEKVIDAIELSFLAADLYTRRYLPGVFHTYKAAAEAKIDADEAIKELNYRFLEHGIGYQYVSGKVIRKDSEFLHKEVMAPTLALLQDQRYAGAQEEFLKAHQDYRHGETKGCLRECLNALESTLKTICTIRKWQISQRIPPRPYWMCALRMAYFPDWLLSHYSALRSTLESGVPTVRNKLGGHGQGPEPVTVPPHVAAYMLHLTGTTIHFLVEAEKALK